MVRTPRSHIRSSLLPGLQGLVQDVQPVREPPVVECSCGMEPEHLPSCLRWHIMEVGTDILGHKERHGEPSQRNDL